MRKVYIDEIKLKKLKLLNYRKFSEKEIYFSDSNFILIVGENASGKTAIIDAIATSIGGFINWFSEVSPADTHGFKPRDIKFLNIDKNNNIEKILSEPSEIIGDYSLNQKNISWKRTIKSIKSKTSMTIKENNELYSIVKSLEKHSKESSESVILPIFSYHGTGRLWEQDKTFSLKSNRSINNISRYFAYKESLVASSNYRNFLAWFEKMDWNSYNMREDIPILEVVRTTIKEALELLTEEKIENVIFREGDLEIKFSDRREWVSYLSDGYRNIIGMVSDIAYRMVVLNPSLTSKAIKETPGIVLIDEIDLHLHPKWQKKIVNLLRNLFPKVQFIATSHSPFIIQSADKNEVIMLDEELIETGNGISAVNKSIEDIAEEIMGVENPQWSEKRNKMAKAAEEYYLILEKIKGKNLPCEELEIYKKNLDKLSEPFLEDVAYSTFLKMERLKVEYISESKL